MRQLFTVNASQRTAGPGLYVVTAPNVTLTLENWSYWPDADKSVVVKDLTGQSNPNISIVAPLGGLVDGAATTIVSTAYQTLRIIPYEGGVNWVVDSISVPSMQGPPGATGPTGATGPQGTVGPQGSPGATGATGAPGAQGAAGQTAVIVGQFGASKTPANLPVNGVIPVNWDAAGAPPAQLTMQLGQALLYTANSHVWVYVGVAMNAAGWIDMGANQGPAGPQGATGATGATGAAGAAGAQGSTGATGPQGPAGATGATGPTGAAGATGAQGPAGPAGDNRIINGDMRIDQRNNGASGTAISYAIDRWYFSSTLATKGTWGRSLGAITGPVGFPYYFGFQSNSAYTPLAGDYFAFVQAIEADMVGDFAFGTANAQSITLSFWARSSLTGTFGGSVQNYADTRSYPFSYALSTANTWTKIILTVPGDTGGTWVMNGNSGSMTVSFDFGAGTTYRGPANAWASANYVGATGSVNVVSTNAATFYVTGVKLEVGSVATPFNWKSPARSLADCQRYFSTSYSGVAPGAASTTSGQLAAYQSGLTSATNTSYLPISFPVTMRIPPTMTYYSPVTGASGKGRDNQNNADVTAANVAAGYSNTAVQLQASAAATNIYFTVHYTASAEL